MPHVLLPRLIGERGLAYHRFPAVVHNDVLAVGIDRGPKEEDDVIEDLLDRRIRRSLREQLVSELRRVLGSSRFRRMQPAADVHDHLAFARKSVGFFVRKPRRMREPHVDLPIVIELRVILRRCDDCHGPFAAKRGLADIQKVDAVARRRQLLEIFDGLFIIEHLAIGANRVTEK